MSLDELRDRNRYIRCCIIPMRMQRARWHGGDNLTVYCITRAPPHKVIIIMITIYATVYTYSLRFAGVFRNRPKIEIRRNLSRILVFVLVTIRAACGCGNVPISRVDPTVRHSRSVVKTLRNSLKSNQRTTRKQYYMIDNVMRRGCQ